MFNKNFIFFNKKEKLGKYIGKKESIKKICSFYKSQIRVLKTICFSI